MKNVELPKKNRNSSFDEFELRKRRQQIIQAIEAGKSDSAIASELKTSRLTVRRMRQRLEEAKRTHTEVNLCSKQRGSKPALRTWQEEEIRQLMANKSPAIYFPSAKSGKWTSSLLAKAAKLKYGLTVSMPTMRRYMNKWAEIDADQRISRDQLPPPGGHSADECLILEICAWTLEDVPEIVQMTEGIGAVSCFAREAFASIGRQATIYRRIKTLKEKLLARQRELNSLNSNSLSHSSVMALMDTRQRRRLHERLIRISNQIVGRKLILSPFELPGVWSMRLVPVRFFSPAVDAHLSRVSGEKQRKRQGGNGDSSTKVSPQDGNPTLIKSVSQERVLALAYDLRTGGYLMELFYSPVGDEAPLLSNADIEKFLGRLKDDLRRRGGSIHLPEPLEQDRLSRAHQTLFDAAKRQSFTVSQDMPPASPLKVMPYVRTNNAMVTGRPVCRENRTAIPYCVLDPETPEPFTPRPPNRKVGRPINIERYALKKPED